METIERKVTALFARENTQMLRPLFEANFDKVEWYNLSRNPNAIHLL